MVRDDTPIPLRPFVATVCMACVLLGVWRGVAMALYGGASPRFALRLVGVGILGNLLWVPVAAYARATWRPSLARRTRGIANIVGAVAVAVIEPVWARWLLLAIGVSMPSPARLILGRLDTNLLFYGLLVALCWLAVSTAHRRAALRRAAELDAAASSAQLHVLALQLHPHFLFNTLNLASQLAYSNVSAALATLSSLRMLLLESLEHAADRDVSLSEELRFLKSYLFIQAARFGDRLRVEFAIAPEALTAAVPHLMLQPLVENAIAHGIAPRDAGGSVTISADRIGDQLRIQIDDSGQGLSPNHREGLGLTITRLRLRQLFGDEFRLTVSARRDGGTHVGVDVPFTTHETQAAPTTDLGSSAHDEAANPSSIPELAWWRRFPLWAQLLGAWGCVAIVWLAIATVRGALIPSLGEYGEVIVNVSNALIWAGCSVVPLLAARRFDLAEHASARRLWAHAGIATGTAVLHLSCWLATLWVLDRPQYSLQMTNRFAWFGWDIAAYAAIVAIASTRVVRRQIRDAQLDIERANAALARAHVAATRLRLQPAILFRALDAASEAVRRAPRAGEHAITRLGDLLRALLRSRDHEFATLADEIELLETFLAIVGPAPVRVTAASDLALFSIMVPSTLSLPIVAALGPLRAVDVVVSETRLEWTFSSVAELVDLVSLRGIERRLATCYGDRAVVTLRREQSGVAELVLVLPLDPGAENQLDELPPAMSVA